MNKELMAKVEMYKKELNIKIPDTIKIEELDEYIKKIEQELLSLF